MVSPLATDPLDIATVSSFIKTFPGVRLGWPVNREAQVTILCL